MVLSLSKFPMRHQAANLTIDPSFPDTTQNLTRTASVYPHRMASSDMGQGVSQPLDLHDPSTPNSLPIDLAPATEHPIDIPNMNTTSPNALPEATDASTVVSSIPNDEALNTSEEVQRTSDTSEENQFHWDLRPSRGPQRSKAIAWYDHDETGDFDHREEAKRLRPPKKKTKISSREKCDGNGQDIADFDMDFESKLPPSLVVRLDFKTSSGKAQFGQLCADIEAQVKLTRDDFAEGYQLRKRKVPAEDGPLDVPGIRVTTLSNSAFGLPDDISNHPAARGCYTCLAMGVTCSLLENEHKYPCDECEENGDDCQMVTEPKLKMACEHCQYLSKKQKWRVCSFACERDPAQHRGPCKQCIEDDHQPCIAGPRPDQVHTRVRIGWDGQKWAPYTNQPISASKFSYNITCRACLEARRVCSFASGSSRDSEHTCTACDMSGTACEPLGTLRAPQNRPQSRPQISADNFEDGVDDTDMIKGLDSMLSDGLDELFLTKPAVSTAKEAIPSSSKGVISTKHHDPNVLSFYPGPSKSSPRAEKPPRTQTDATEDLTLISSEPRSSNNKNNKNNNNKKGDSFDRPISVSPDPPSNNERTTQTVRTRFCHPIKFHREPPTGPERAPICNFCRCNTYSMLGLEEREVEIIEQHNGAQWQEISGGHRSEGVRRTELCHNCTKARVDIVLCVDHDLRRIASEKAKTDVWTALAKLIDGESTGEERWCSVCCNLAVWECQTKQVYEHRAEGEGCGLALCEHCARELHEHGGIFERMLQGLLHEASEERPVGLRADYELLKWDGLLMNYMMQ